MSNTGSFVALTAWGTSKAEGKEKGDAVKESLYKYVQPR